MPGFFEKFVECAERWPRNACLEIQRGDGLESHTYAEVREMAESVAAWIQRRGIERGSRLAILADNHPRWVVAYLGSIAAGCVAVPLDTAFHASQVAKLLKDSGSVVLFTDGKHLATGSDAVAGTPVKMVLTGELPQASSSRQGGPSGPAGGEFSAVAETLDRIFAAGPGSFTPVASQPDDLAALGYTSGTTADPKGVMLTHGNLMGEAAAVFGLFHLDARDALLGVLPLFHVLAQMANLFLPLVAGARVVYLETLNTTELLRALRDREITAFAVVPQFFYLIHERILKEVRQRGAMAERGLRLLMGVNRILRRIGINGGPVLFRPVHATFGKKMRFLVSGGSRFEPAIARDFHDLGLDVLQAYGLTETTGGAFVTPPGDVAIGSAGKPLPGVQARILDPAQPEEGGPASGEIAISGPIVMQGYWNRPDASTAALKDGWLLTGDLGYFDADGNLFISGRKKELIILSNGKNIYPEEIESHYLKNRLIKEVCVLALEATPGDPTSERLHAVIVPNVEALKQEKIVNVREAIRYYVEALSTQLPSTKRVGSFEVWQEELPRTTTRKIKRFEVAKRVRANQAARQFGGGAQGQPAELSELDQQWLRQPQVETAIRVIRERARTRPDAIRPGDNLELDLGLDSMQRVELLSALEDELGGDVEEARLAEIYTVRELVETVLQSASSGAARSASRGDFAGWKAILSEEPTDPGTLAIAKDGRVHEASLFLLSRLIQVFALDKFSLQVRGLEKLPEKSPFILCSNHQSYLDPIIMASVLPWRVFRNFFSVGTSDIFGSQPMRYLARWLRVVVVDPDVNLIPAMRAGAYGLRRGRNLVLYPEGERSITGKPIVFKKGAAILSIHLQAPIVPVAIEGFYEVWPRAQKFQGFKPVKMVFGDPIYPPPESEASEEAYARLSDRLRTTVTRSWEQLRAEGRQAVSPEQSRAATAH